MILSDPYAMHRKWWQWDWKPDPILDTEWTDWDYILASTNQTIEDYTNQNNGQWRPFDESGDVYWDVKSSFSGSESAIEKEKASRSEELEPGETLYAVPVFDDNKPKPTLATWAKDLEEEKADLRPAEAHDSVPPTPLDLQNMLAAGREKLKSAKLGEA